MQDLDDFLREREPAKTGKQSVLLRYVAEILELKNRGYSERVILDFLLEKKGITISQQTLNRFIRSQMAKNIAPILKEASVPNQEHLKDKNVKIDTNQQPNDEQQEQSNELVRSAASRTDRPGIRRWPSADEIDVSTLY